MLFWGYLKANLKRQPRLVSDTEAILYRQMLNIRIEDKVLSMFSGGPTRARKFQGR